MVASSSLCGGRSHHSNSNSLLNCFQAPLATPDSDFEDFFPAAEGNRRGRKGSKRRSRIRSSASEPQLNKRRLRSVEFTGSPRFPSGYPG